MQGDRNHRAAHQAPSDWRNWNQDARPWCPECPASTRPCRNEDRTHRGRHAHPIRHHPQKGRSPWTSFVIDSNRITATTLCRSSSSSTPTHGRVLFGKSAIVKDVWVSGKNSRSHSASPLLYLMVSPFLTFGRANTLNLDFRLWLAISPLLPMPSHPTAMNALSDFFPGLRGLTPRAPRKIAEGSLWIVEAEEVLEPELSLSQVRKLKQPFDRSPVVHLPSHTLLSEIQSCVPVPLSSLVHLRFDHPGKQ